MVENDATESDSGLFNRIKGEIDTDQISKVVNVDDDGASIDVEKAREVAYDQNWWTVKGATGGAIVGALVTTTGIAAIPAAAVGAAIGYGIDNDSFENVDELEQDFQTILEAVEQREEVELSQLAIITSTPKDELQSEYLPELEKQGIIKIDEGDNMVIYKKSVVNRAISFFNN